MLWDGNIIVPLAGRAALPENLTPSLGLPAHIIKKLLLAGITSDSALALLAPFRPRCATVLFLHRFAMPDFGVTGHDPVVLRRHLEYLRRRRYRLMGLPEMLTHVEQETPFRERAVLFTVDDGYADFAAVAAPVFAAYDCPVTVFLITDFTSGKLWNWFDRVPWVINQSDRDGLTIEISGVRVALKWRNALERAAAGEEIVERLKRVPDEEKEKIIGLLPDALEVAIPLAVPERDRAMTWEQVRSCAPHGVTFGPHTVTHPILSQVDALRSEHEISESWRRVAAQTDAAVPVFCYPNGTPADFSLREKESVARAGMRAAVSTVEASVVSDPSSRGVSDRFAIPRFAYPEAKPSFVQIASGLEALRGRIVPL